MYSNHTTKIPKEKPNCYKKLTGYQMEAENCCDDCDDYETCVQEMIAKHPISAEKPKTQIPYLIYDRLVDLLRPDLIDVNMQDVYRALPKLNRFNGQTDTPYSVARHSIACVNVAVEEYGFRDIHLLLAVLLHDAPEAYIGDIVRPLRTLFGSKIDELETVLMHKFFAPFNFTQSEQYDFKAFEPTLREIDNRMCATECSVLTKQRILPEVKLFDKKYVDPRVWQTDEYVFKAVYTVLTYARSKNLKEVTI